MQNARVDRNQAVIVDGLRKFGASVQSLATVGKGVPDLLVGYNGLNWLLEVKGENGKLTTPQVGWHSEWRGAVYVVRTLGEAIGIISQEGQKSEAFDND